MCNDRLEILDTDDDVKLLFNGELAKLESVDGDCGM